MSLIEIHFIDGAACETSNFMKQADFQSNILQALIPKQWRKRHKDMGKEMNKNHIKERRAEEITMELHF